jgi:ABC-type transporter Mla subunit MlaD
MKTPAELIEDLRSTLFPMEDDALAIHQLSTLLSVLTACSDAETTIDGINRLSHILRDHADNLRRLHDQASQIAHRLGNP